MAKEKPPFPFPFSIRLSFDERAQLEQAAGNMALGAYIREKLLREYVAHYMRLGREAENCPKLEFQKAECQTRSQSQDITPALEKSGWDMMSQVREEVSFTDGRIFVKGNLTSRGKCKRADYILYYKPNIPIAIIEAKDNKQTVRAGIQQGLDYAEILDIPSVFSSNGDGFFFHDRTAMDGTIEKEISLENFPTPKELWEKYKKYKGIETQEQERISSQDYFFDGSGRTPRYYQQIAINRTVEAIAKGQQRILLTMATGTHAKKSANNTAH